MARRSGEQATERVVVPKKQPLDPKLVDKIVEMYTARVEGTNRPRYTYAEITRATHVPRGTQIYYLQQRGIPTDRLGTASTPSRVPNNTLLDRLSAAEQECGQLRAERDRLRATLDTLLDRLGITPAAAARALKAPITKGSRDANNHP